MRKFLFILVGASLLALPLKAQDVEISGLVDVGLVHSLNNPAANAGGAVDSFDVNLAQLAVSSEADPVGFNLVLDFGNVGQLDVQNASIEYTTEVGNGLALSVGRIDTLAGREVVESSENWFSSNGLLFGLVPTRHTGVRGAYPVSDSLTVTLGFNNGSDLDVDNNRSKSLEAQIAYSASEEWDIAFTILYGAEDAPGAGGESEKDFVLNIVTTYDVSEDLSVYAEYTYLSNEEDRDTNGDGTANGDQTTWGINLGAQYRFSDVYGASVRFETVNAEGAAAAADNDQWELTLTGHCWLADNLEFRVEYRHDDSDNAIFADDSAAGTDQEDNSIGIQLLYTF